MYVLFTQKLHVSAQNDCHQVLYKNINSDGIRLLHNKMQLCLGGLDMEL